MIFAEFGVGQVVWSVLWLSLFALWFFLIVMVFSDIFLSRSMSGWAKAGWVLAVLALPFFGVFIYLVVNGGGKEPHTSPTVQDS